LGLSALAFGAFYGRAYFSRGYRGMLGYENKDALTQLMAYANSAQQGSTLYWDPVYFQYTPRVPLSPISSPVTGLLLLLVRTGWCAGLSRLLPAYLLVLALLQIGCALTMSVFLRSAGLGFWPSALGGLVYAYNHHTFAFGIRHGYERISAVLLAPLFVAAFLRALDSPPGSPRRRLFAAAAALGAGIALASNGDVKPAAFFCFFLALAAIFYRPFSRRHLALLAAVLVLAAGISVGQILPTAYSLPEQGRGAEGVAEVMEFSLTPAQMVLTHLWTGFTPRRDYPWENTAEFSMSMMPLVLLGLAALFRHRWRNIFLAALAFSCLWMMGKYTPLAPLQGWVMKTAALRHPARMGMLLYFCYGFLAALGVQSLRARAPRRALVWSLFLIPLAMLALRLAGAGEIPPRFILCSFLSCSLLALLAAGVLPARAVGLAALFFILERSTVFTPLEKTTVTDPTVYYPFDEIYRAHPRVQAILSDPRHGRYRAFFGAGDLPGLFSHNLYLNAFQDGIRPIFPYLYIDEEMRRVREIQEVLFSDWSHPMWGLLNVRYFVDLDRYFAVWGEADSSRRGLESLAPLDERVRENRGAEEELFVRYRRRRVESDGWFLDSLRSGDLDISAVAFLDGISPEIAIPAEGDVPFGGEKIEIRDRRPDEVVVSVTLPRPGVLVFSEFWFFPWSATVDGRPRPLRRAYHVLQAVELDAGEHLVRFYFNAHHWKFVLPALFSAVLLVVLAVYMIRQRRRLGPSPGGGPAVPPRG
jgi:hypothetical protein